MVVKSRDREQSGNGSVLSVKAPVRENQDVGAFFYEFVGAGEYSGERLLDPLGSFFGIEKGGDHFASELFPAKRLQLLDLGVSEKRGLELYFLAAFLLGAQYVGRRPERDHGPGYKFLSYGVNCGICDLGEHLLEIVVKKLRLVRQRRKRSINSHGPHRLDGVFRHRAQKNAQVLKRVAENSLPRKKL